MLTIFLPYNRNGKEKNLLVENFFLVARIYQDYVEFLILSLEEQFNIVVVVSADIWLKGDFSKIILCDLLGFRYLPPG